MQLLLVMLRLVSKVRGHGTPKGPLHALGKGSRWTRQQSWGICSDQTVNNPKSPDVKKENLGSERELAQGHTASEKQG